MDIRSITNVYNNAIGRAIVRRKIPHFRILKKSSTFQVGLGYKQRRFLYDDINSSAASRICNNKSFTKYFLRQLGVPVPIGEKIYDAGDLERKFKTIKKPVVIKPVSEMWGKGISTNITTLDGAKRAYAIAARFHGEYVIMEEHVTGDDYRLLFLGGKYIAGLKRSPPFVTGNGVDTIEILIAKENAQRKKSTRIIKEILVDAPVINFLKKNGYSLKSVLPRREVLRIRMTGNISSGGISENITDIVHPSMVRLGEEIVSYIGLEIGGVDVLTSDITLPLEKTGGKVTEINQNPDIVMHTKPYIGKPIDTAGLFIDYMFPSREDAWIDIWCAGKKIRTQRELNKNLRVVPKKVVYIHRGSRRMRTIACPDKPLFNYLISNRTYSVTL